PAPAQPNGDRPPATPANLAHPHRLAAAVSGELREAADHLTPAQRELLALRELLGLSYPELATVTGLPEPEVALALAGARLDLRTALRGPSATVADCVERDRALQVIAGRQDGLAVSAADEDWLIGHLGHCRACGQAHASMLEASACYRAWAPDDGAGERPA
ncbi:MAG: sigma factor-like helix-turn-helix DNA-binding protein, partial [Solirubrobacteraceae bacterium]